LGHISPSLSIDELWIAKLAYTLMKDASIATKNTVKDHAWWCSSPKEAEFDNTIE
jgi:hypothetical protein